MVWVMNKNAEFVYLDYASTSPVDNEVLVAMEPWMTTEFANASSTHTMGYESRKAVDTARAVVADTLNSSSQEIIFTGGGTESVNIALFGVAREVGQGHIVTSAIEHPSVLDTCRALEKEGFELSVVMPDENGIVSVDAVSAEVREDTILVSVMYANNEVGTIQSVKEIASAVKEKNPNVLFHTDACQASGALSLDVKELGVDLLTINASKIYGPKGVGALYIKNGVKLKPLMYGGGQERGLRPGTENVAGIVGFAKALEIADRDREEESVRLIGLRDSFAARLLELTPGAELNGDALQRLPNNINVLFKGVSGEALMIHLDQAGIQASLGSACAAGVVGPSHVLLAMGRSKEEASSSVRFTLGRQTTGRDIQFVLEVFPEIISKLTTN